MRRISDSPETSKEKKAQDEMKNKEEELHTDLPFAISHELFFGNELQALSIFNKIQEI